MNNCYSLEKIKCVLFDRDGTLGNLSDKRFPQTFSPFCDIKKTFDEIKQKGYLVGIITNQSSIARGTAIGYDFDAEFSGYGADAWAICPHDDADECDCRKPKNGLLKSICEHLEILPTSCLVVGDRLSDIQCARSLNAQAALVLTGYGKNEIEQVKKEYPNTLILERFDCLLNML